MFVYNFEDPLPSVFWWAVSVGGEELNWHWLAHHQPAYDLILVHTVLLKPMIKAQISGRMLYSGISDVVCSSVYSEKTHLKKLKMIIIITEKPVTSKQKKEM